MYADLLNTALAAGKKSAAAILSALDKPKNLDFKGRTDLVTDSDRRSEEIIISQIIKNYPDHGLLAEESGKKTGNSDFLWVIDPLDGTTNFVHGFPAFAVSIACLKKGIPVIGVCIELPEFKIYSAQIHQGAFLDNVPIKVSRNRKLSQSLLVTGFGYEHGDLWQTNLKLFKLFTAQTRGVHRTGSAVLDLCYVARGIYDGFWELDLHPWDTAAGIILVNEAGGKVTGMDGLPFSIFKKQLLAANSALHPEMLREMKVEINKLKKIIPDL
ncbi:MAG: inositol monophosphatase family protein [Candidatus Neomarinimicrobiota bacterium]